MTEDEIRKVAEVLLTADGGCPVCVSGLVDRIKQSLPSPFWNPVLKELDPDGFMWDEEVV